MEQQPSLFPDAKGPQTEPVDIDAIAKKIGASARHVEYEDRTSEAAKDQGWGPVEPAVQEAARPKPTNAEQRKNAAKHVAEHLKRTNKQVIDPYYG
jgi:hypothetical protein